MSPMHRQSRVPVPEQHPPEASKNFCEWCEEDTPATVAIERRGGTKWMPTGQYVFACTKHEAVARKSLERKPRQPRI